MDFTDYDYHRELDKAVRQLVSCPLNSIDAFAGSGDMQLALLNTRIFAGNLINGMLAAMAARPAGRSPADASAPNPCILRPRARRA